MKLSYNGNILRKPTSYPDQYRGALTLREKCPNTEFFLVRIFLYSGRIQENTDQEKHHIWALFTKCNAPLY